jgi:hypothetical protein
MLNRKLFLVFVHATTHVFRNNMQPALLASATAGWACCCLLAWVNSRIGLNAGASWWLLAVARAAESSPTYVTQAACLFSLPLNS